METGEKDDRLNIIVSAICLIEHDIVRMMCEQVRAYRESRKIEDRIVHEQYDTPPEKRVFKFPYDVPEICREEGEFRLARKLEYELRERRDRLIELFDDILFGPDNEC